MWGVRIPPHDEPIEFGAAFTDGGDAPSIAARAMPAGTPAVRWPQEVTTTRTRSPAKDAYVVDDIALPVDNPWRRNVRPGDIQFLQDGTGVIVTLDGDVWLVRGLHEPAGPVRWRRFASGLHEPLTLAIRDEQVYVFDRNGIWRLRDTNGDGEADVHELFSNAFATDRRHARVPEHHPARARRRVRHRQGEPAGDDDRQAQRAACCASRPTAAARRCSATGSASRISA